MVQGRAGKVGCEQAAAVFVFIKSCQLMRFALSLLARSLFPTLSLSHFPLSLSLSHSIPDSPFAYIKSISASSKAPFLNCLSNVCVCLCVGGQAWRGG